MSSSSTSSSSSASSALPCSYATMCTRPSNELLRQCSDSCRAMIHPSCAPLGHCPFHSDDLPSRLAGCVPLCPPQHTELFNEFQSGEYTTAVLKNGQLYDELVSEAKTQAGDKVLVFDTPRDGNCVINSLVRGFFQGFPLSPLIQERAMISLRDKLSTKMREHQWSGPWVAFPQTIDEAIHSTATPGEWVGELAIASFATIAGVIVQVWQYMNNDSKCGIIQPTSRLTSLEPNNNNHIIVNILQSRNPLPNRPEHNSHYSSVHLLPIIPSTPPIEYGPCTINAQYKYYQWIQNKRNMRISVQDIVTIKGRNPRRMVHTIRIHNAHKNKLLFQLISLDSPSYPLSPQSKALSDILTQTPPTPDDIKLYESLLTPPPSNPSTPSIILDKKRTRTPVKPLRISHTSSNKKQRSNKRKGRKIPAKKKPIISSSLSSSSSSSSDDDNDDSDDDVKELKTHSPAPAKQLPLPAKPIPLSIPIMATNANTSTLSPPTPPSQPHAISCPPTPTPPQQQPTIDHTPTHDIDIQPTPKPKPYTTQPSRVPHMSHYTSHGISSSLFHEIHAMRLTQQRHEMDNHHFAIMQHQIHEQYSEIQYLRSLVRSQQ